MALHLLVRGPYACFRRPEFKHDLVSYDAMTPPVGRMILERLYRPEGLRWSLDRIDILNPVRFEWLERPNRGDGARICALRDVAYRLSGRLIDTGGCDRSDVHRQAFDDRLAGCGTVRAFQLGLREFVAELAPPNNEVSGDWAAEPLDLGWMPFNTGPARGDPVRYFHAIAVAGSIDLTGPEVADLVG